MCICLNCKFSEKVTKRNDKYYCKKNIYEHQDKHNNGNFGCVRGIKK